MTIRLSDPRAGYLAHRAEIDRAIARVLEEGQYILGPEVNAFEAEFGRFLGTKNVISTGNGTDAIELALRAAGIGRGDIVVTVSNTAVATVAAIELAGASALLVEVDERTLTISPEHLDRALSSDKVRGIKAVVIVHLYGQPADLLAIVEICRKHNVLLIEDCAQAHGAGVDGRLAGTWGCAAAFSFYPTKNLGALGDGGAVATNNEALAERLRQLRLHALEALCSLLTERGKLAQAVDVGLAAVAAEPLRESVHRVLIRAYIAEGNKADAIRQYEVYRDLLWHELAVTPSHHLVTLIDEVRAPASGSPR